MERKAATVRDANGAGGTLEAAPQAGEAGTATVRLASGARVQIERRLLEAQEDGSYRLQGLAFRDLEALGPPAREREEEEVVVPVAEEQVRVRKRARETGRVRISKRVAERTEIVDEPLLREDVDLRRVPVDRPVDEPVEIRREGETTIIPVLEERLVVRKQLVLKEELHVTKRQTERRAPQEVSLRYETVDVQRTDPPRR